MWPRSQVVRQGSAKSLYAGSIPTVASINFQADVVELVYTRDLKSLALTGLWVRVPPSAPVLMSKKFTRKIEDFTCENCGQRNSGNGYTNHCRYCLFSKHVDVNPGDRQSNCGGLMKPVGVDQKSGEYIITHQCLKCGFKKNNKVAKDDNFEMILKIAALRDQE